MLVLSCMALLLVGLLAARVYQVGDGDWRAGRRRSVRRVRAFRRRSLRPGMSRLAALVAVSWTRPVRRSIADQVRRVGDHLDRAAEAGRGVVRAQRELGQRLDRLEEVGPVSWTEPGTPVHRRAQQRNPGHGWVIPSLLGVAAFVVAAGNAWVLYRHVLPSLPAMGTLDVGALDGPYVPAAFALLSLLLGLAHFGLRVAGRALGFHMLAVLAVALVLAQAALEAGAVVFVLEALTLVDLTWWGGVMTATLLAGTAALLPPLGAALAYAAVEGFERWRAARARRAAIVAVIRQDELAEKLGGALERMRAFADSLRMEVAALASEPAGALLLAPDDRRSVQHVLAVLRRAMADFEGNGPATRIEAQPSRPAAVTGRILLDVGSLMVWLAAAGASLGLVAPALQEAASRGGSSLLTAGAFAVTAALLLAGAGLRYLVTALSSPFGTPGRTGAVFFLGLGAAGFAYALGPLAAGGGAADSALLAAGWLNALLLTAAVASIRLPEGIAAVAGLITAALGVAAWILLWIADLVLAVLDRALVGFGRPPSLPLRPATRRPEPATGTIGRDRSTR